MSTKVDFSYKALFRQAAIDAFKKLHPREEIKNLVMFVVWLGSIWTTIFLFLPGQCNLFNVQICFWLWFTCLFANFAEAMAEGRGKAHADALRALRTHTMARKLVGGKEVPTAANELRWATCLSARPATLWRATARWWKVSRPWMNRPLLVSPRRSCAKA